MKRIARVVEALGRGRAVLAIGSTVEEHALPEVTEPLAPGDLLDVDVGAAGVRVLGVSTRSDSTPWSPQGDALRELP